MLRLGLSSILCLALAVVLSGCVPDVRGKAERSPNDNLQKAAMQSAAPEPPPPPPPKKKVNELLASGIVIVISLSSQEMYVFRDGILWRSSPISSGKRKKETPQGVFAILQKKTFHRSNLYSNAPMPFMQRLTWGGIAIHAGRLPGYPASHGCIRVPKDFAKALFEITSPATTAVIVVDEPLASEAEALALARRNDSLVPIDPALLVRERDRMELAKKPAQGGGPASVPAPAPAPKIQPPPVIAKNAALPVPSAEPAAGQQTIQLAAALSPANASAQWEALASRSPKLRAMQMAVVPAVVNGTQYYRLRASAPDAHATCSALKREGIECFSVS